MSNDRNETRRLTVELPEYIWEHIEREACKEQKTVDEFVSALLIRQRARLYGDVAHAIYDRNKAEFNEVVEKEARAYFDSVVHAVDSFEDDYGKCIFGKGFAAGFRYGVEKSNKRCE